MYFCNGTVRSSNLFNRKTNSQAGSRKKSQTINQFIWNFCVVTVSRFEYIRRLFHSKGFCFKPKKTKLFIRCVVVKIENPQTGEIFCLMIFLLLFHLTTSVDSVFSLIKDIRRYSAVEWKMIAVSVISSH